MDDGSQCGFEFRLEFAARTLFISLEGVGWESCGVRGKGESSGCVGAVLHLLGLCFRLVFWQLDMIRLLWFLERARKWMGR